MRRVFAVLGRVAEYPLVEKQPKSNSLSTLKQKEFQAKMGYTFALEIFFFQPVSEGKLAVSLWGGNYCTATTKQRRVH